MLGPGVGDGDLAARHAHRGQVRRGHHPVGHDRVPGGPQRLHALDLNARGAGAAHDGAHVAEHGGQVGHLGLLRRVLDHRRALGQHGRHEQVVRRRVARVLQDDPGADQAAPRHRPPHLAVGRLEAGAHGAEAAEVEVDRPVAEVVPARQRHPHGAAAGQEEPEDDDRGPHPLEQLVGARGHQLALGRGGHAHIPVVEALDPRPDAAQHLGHGLDVGDAGHVGEHGAPLGQQAGRHQLERRILGAACPDGAPERAAGLDHDLIHDPKYRRWRAAGPASGRSATNYGQGRGDVAPGPRPQPRHGPRAGHRGGRHGGQPLDGPGRQARCRRRRRRGHADRALQRADGRDRRHRRGREGQRADALQRGEDRRRHSPADRHRGGPHRRDHPDRPGPGRRPGRHRRGRARRHVRPRPLRLHGEAGRGAPRQGRLRHPAHAHREPATPSPRPSAGRSAT